MTSPTDGSNFSSDTIVFSWNRNDAMDNSIQVDDDADFSSPIAYLEHVSSPQEVTGLPYDGRTLYARLYSDMGGEEWPHEDYTYTTHTGEAVLISPEDGFLLHQNTTFVWEQYNAQNIALGVSATVECLDDPECPENYFYGEYLTSPVTVDNLPEDGSTVYVRLWSDMGGPWIERDYVYQTLLPACGDINGSGGNADISDLVYLIAYMFQDGPAPYPMWTANVDGSASVNPDISDLVYLVAYMFAGGPDLQCGGGPVMQPSQEAIEMTLSIIEQSCSDCDIEAIEDDLLKAQEGVVKTEAQLEPNLRLR